MSITIGIEKGQDDFVLSNGSATSAITGADYLRIYGAIDSNLFIGFNGTGLDLTGLKIGMVSVNYGGYKYSALKASGAAALVGIDPGILQLSGSASVVSNKSTDPSGKVLDFINTSSNATDDDAEIMTIDNYDDNPTTNVVLNLTVTKGNYYKSTATTCY